MNYDTELITSHLNHLSTSQRKCDLYSNIYSDWALSVWYCLAVWYSLSGLIFFVKGGQIEGMGIIGMTGGDLKKNGSLKRLKVAMHNINYLT